MSLIPQRKTPGDILYPPLSGDVTGLSAFKPSLLSGPPSGEPSPIPNAFGLDLGSQLRALSGRERNVLAPNPLLSATLDRVRLPATRRRVFISFQSEDLAAVELIRSIAGDDNYDFDIYDESLREPFDSVRADYIRSRILEHISRTSVTICILGKTTFESKWVDWELMQSLEKGNKLILMGVPGETRLRRPQVFEQTGAGWHEWNIAWLKSEIESAPDPKPHR